MPKEKARRAGNKRVGGIAGAGLALLAFGAELFGGGGCQVGPSFRGPGFSDELGVTAPDAGETVVVAITHAVLDGKNRDAFDEYTQKVIKSLRGNDGYIGYAVRTRIFGNEVWTMTVWRDEESTKAFVRSPVHQEAIRRGLAGVKTAQFLRFEWPRSEVPPSWDEVKRRLQEVEVVDYSGEGGK